MQVMFYLYLFSIYTQVMCKHKNGVVKSKNPLPYFRRQVEGLTEDTTIHASLNEDLPNNLVSFLIKNVKKIYNDLDEVSQLEKSTSVCTSTKDYFLVGTASKLTSDILSENHVDLNSSTESHDTTSSRPTDVTAVSDRSRAYSNDNMAMNKHVTLVHSSDKLIIDVELSTKSYDLTEKEELMHLSKNVISYETDRKQRDYEIQPLMRHGNGSLVDSANNGLRSCIICNNVVTEDCNDPKNRLIPATVCEHDEDLCYSMHTPFGVIDRGCFNANHNLTTYVCACNLCNYISISEMPYIFSKKREWFDNVLELSRTKHFRKSVFKDMACLKCETNASSKSKDMLDTANCLEGNIGSLPTEECKEGEVCAVKAIRKDGYLWRGCVKYPLFNYWWALCDSDLCNYDTIISIYDLE